MTSRLSVDTPLARARTLLFVPGNRPERFEKALTSGADGVVLDLEDSVPATEKARAREVIAAAWSAIWGAAGSRVALVVRISSLKDEAGLADLAWLTQLSPVAGIMLPKAEAASQVEAIHRAMPSVGVLPLIESAAGFIRLPEIARAPGVLRLVVGHLDFMADTGIRCSEGERELDTLRFGVSMHTRDNALAPAIDGVTLSLDDEARLTSDTQRAMNFGFGGKLCIHPRQVSLVHAAMAPGADELAWAQRVLAVDQSAGGAAVQLDGKMVDLPVVLQARRTLAMARIPSKD
jgi:citrate lyase subunit beta / citryl-CoA lyase